MGVGSKGGKTLASEVVITRSLREVMDGWSSTLSTRLLDSLRIKTFITPRKYKECLYGKSLLMLRAATSVLYSVPGKDGPRSQILKLVKAPFVFYHL
jgi:hypothetical protein